MIQRIIIIALILVAGTLSAKAQEYKKIKKLVDKGFYEQALNAITPELEKDSGNAELHYYAGLTRLKLYQQELALEHLLKSSAATDDMYNYYLTVAYFENDRYAEALKTAKLVDRSDLDENQLNLLDNQMISYGKLTRNPEAIVIKNMGDKINTAAHEYSGVMTYDQRSVVFTARRKGDSKMDADGMAYEEIYRTTLDSSDNWQKPTKFKQQSGKKSHDATVAMFDNDTKMITYHDEDLYISELVDGKWTDPAPLDQINFDDSAETHCFITDGFDTIYYATDLYSENADLDLYMITKNGEGEWSEPKPLEALNSPFNDDSPYLAANGDFYFSSKGHNSMGGYDIFKSTFNKRTGKWNEPQNLGYDINSASDDTYFNMFGKIAYLSSGRAGGYGNMDIYTVFLFNKVNIQGQVVDNKTQAAIPGAEVTIFGEEETSTVTDEQGRYSVVIPIEEVFKMNISYQKELIYSASHFARVHFRDFNDNTIHFKVDLEMNEPEEDTEPTELSVIMVNDFDTDPLTLQPDVPEKALATSEIYRKKPAPVAAKKPEMKTLKVAVTKELPKEEPKPEITKPVLPLVQFAFDSEKLEDVYKTGLQQVADFMKEAKGVRLKLTGHTDLMGSTDYNLRLSERRALAVKNYLVRQGVKAEKINLIYKGETSPVKNIQDRSKENRRVTLEWLEDQAVAERF